MITFQASSTISDLIMQINFDINKLDSEYLENNTEFIIAKMDEGILEFLSTNNNNEYITSTIDDFGSYILLKSEEIMDENIPQTFGIKSCYPNPFNPSTSIEYTVEINSEIYITVYNLLGEKIKLLENTIKGPGSYTTHWNGLNEIGQRMSAGIYFIEFKNSNLQDVKKVTLLK